MLIRLLEFVFAVTVLGFILLILLGDSIHNYVQQECLEGRLDYCQMLDSGRRGN